MPREQVKTEPCPECSRFNVNGPGCVKCGGLGYQEVIQIPEDWKIVRRIHGLSGLVVGGGRGVAAVQREFRWLISQTCLAYQYGSSYITKNQAEDFDSANHARNYE